MSSFATVRAGPDKTVVFLSLHSSVSAAQAGDAMSIASTEAEGKKKAGL